MRSLARYGLICVLFAVLMGCGKSDEDVAKLKKEMEDLKATTKQLAQERDGLKQQMATQDKKKEPEQQAPSQPDKQADEPAKTKQTEPDTSRGPEKAREQTDRYSREQSTKPDRSASERPPSRDQNDDRVTDKSRIKGQMCDAIDKFLKDIDSARSAESEAKRKSRMDEALDEILEARAKFLGSKDLTETAAKVYVAVYGVKLNVDTIAKFGSQSDRGTEKFVEAMEKYRKELKALCSGW